jgi:hypothetical protein
MFPLIPHSPIDSLGAPQFGTYAGAFENVNLNQMTGRHHPTPMQRLFSRKKWFYGFVCTHEVAAMWAVADAGYVSNAFSMALDLNSGEVLADESYLSGPRGITKVGDKPLDDLQVRFASASSSFVVNGNQHGIKTLVQLGAPIPLAKKKLRIECSQWREQSVPLTVVSPVPGGIVNVTTKLAGLNCDGMLETPTRRFSLRDGIGGLDYTNGYLARETSWRWAFVCGKFESGERFGINLVEGFNESRNDVNENAIWIDGAVFPLGRARFQFDKSDPLNMWQVSTTDNALNMTFKPIATHREHRDLKVVQSFFVQPMGVWSGQVHVRNKRYQFAQAAGVSENQKVMW